MHGCGDSDSTVVEVSVVRGAQQVCVEVVVNSVALVELVSIASMEYSVNTPPWPLSGLLSRSHRSSRSSHAFF